MPSPTLRSWLQEEPFTLALSSSFFGFYSHCAIVSHLFGEKLYPQKITGTSAGALVGGALASGMTPEDFRDLLFSKTLEDYWDPKWGLGAIAGKKFLKIMKDHFVPTFDKAVIPLEVGALDLFGMKTRFLNQGLLPESVLASCAVPLMFPPIKMGRRFYYDGGVFNKAGINPTDQKQRVLSIYLESKGRASIYETKRNFSRLGESHHALYFKDVPFVNFRNLKTGEEAYHKMYHRAKGMLDRLLAGKIIRIN